MCMPHFLYPSISRYLDCFCLLAVVNNGAVNMDMQISLIHFPCFWIYIHKCDCWVRGQFFFYFLNVIGIQLTYSVILVSSVQLSDSIIHKDIFLLFQILFPYRLLSRVPVLYVRSLLVIYFLYSCVYVNPKLPASLSPLVTVSLFSKSECLFLLCK